jgi:uncharacterized Fe-S center protein
MKQKINDFQLKLKDGRWLSVNGFATVTPDCDCDGRPSHYCVSDATVSDAVQLQGEDGDEVCELKASEIDKVRDEVEESLVEEAYSISGRD